MQKKHFFCLFSFLFIVQSVFAEIQPGLEFIDDGLGSSDTVDPIETIQAFIKSLLTLLGLIFVIPGAVGLYLGPSLGAYLLSKKYAPDLHPALSWIPIVRLYPLTKSAGISGWWSLSFLCLIIWFLPIYIYVYFKLAKKLGRGIGTTIGLFFLPHFMIAYLGLKEAGKSTWPAWIFGLSGLAIVLIFFAWTITSLIFNILSGSTVPA